MKLLVKVNGQNDFQEYEIEKGTTAKQLVAELKTEPRAPILAAKCDNSVEELDFCLDGISKLELLDISNQSAKLMFQNALIMVYLVAVRDVLGNEEVRIVSSLGSGLYTEIGIGQTRKLSHQEIDSIAKRMTELVANDEPILRRSIGREELMAAIKTAKHLDLAEKEKMVRGFKDTKEFEYFELCGYRNGLNGKILPSAGYVYDFKLKKYLDGVVLMHPYRHSLHKAEDTVEDDVKFDKMYLQAKKWQEIQGIYYVGDLNEKVFRGEGMNIVQVSEALHNRNIVAIADKIIKQKKRIILIAGPSSSGKTTFARRLCINLQVLGAKPLYLGTDDYFLNRDETPVDENGEKDYENLNALDIKLFNDNLNALLRGETVDIPEFDFVSGEKVFGKRLVKISDKQPIVIEGIHGLNGELTPFVDEAAKFKIYISPMTPVSIDKHNRISISDARMLRRMVRDNKFRGGKSAEATIHEWPKVRAGEDKNIFRFNREADCFFNTSHAYEICVLKKYAEPMLRAVSKDQDEYEVAQRLLKILSYFETIDEKYIQNTSILREFIGGSVFVE